MTPINPLTGHTFENAGALLNPALMSIVNQRIAESGYDDEFLQVGFVNQEVFTKDGIVTSMIGPEALKEVKEGESTPLINKEQGYEKGFKVKQYAGKLVISKLLSKWIMKNESLSSADNNVQEEIRKLMDDVAYLADGAKLTLNNEAIKVLAEGFVATSAYGAGSASGDGQALISDAHIVKRTGATYDNKLTAVLAAASLEDAINTHKTGIRMGNGRRVRTADVYTLLVPRALETTARKILTADGLGTGSYDPAQITVFDFKGSKVELIVSDVLGQPDDNGGIIGTDTMWFVINATLARQIKAFRFFELYGQELETWEDKDTGNHFVKLDMAFAVDHFQPEVIVGSDGTV